jgi:DNA uptake protein ComE-like DNA-binding protein
LVNINKGSASDLDLLTRIGPVYAQNIVEHRPYSTMEELTSKGAIKQTLYEKIKNPLMMY